VVEDEKHGDGKPENGEEIVVKHHLGATFLLVQRNNRRRSKYSRALDISSAVRSK